MMIIVRQQGLKREHEEKETGWREFYCLVPSQLEGFGGCATTSKLYFTSTLGYPKGTLLQCGRAGGCR